MVARPRRLPAQHQLSASHPPSAQPSSSPHCLSHSPPTDQCRRVARRVYQSLFIRGLTSHHFEGSVQHVGHDNTVSKLGRVDFSPLRYQVMLSPGRYNQSVCVAWLTCRHDHCTPCRTLSASTTPIPRSHHQMAFLPPVTSTSPAELALRCPREQTCLATLSSSWPYSPAPPLSAGAASVAPTLSRAVLQVSQRQGRRTAASQSRPGSPALPVDAAVGRRTATCMARS